MPPKVAVVSAKKPALAASAAPSIDEPLKRVHILVSGKVQGVFFRKHTADKATALGLLGWVRNLDDGRVEAVAEGPTSAVDMLCQWCHKGSPRARVDGVAVEEAPVKLGQFKLFAVDRQDGASPSTSF